MISTKGGVIVDWLDELDDVLNFIKMHDERLLSKFNDDLALILKELESLCYVLLDEKKKRWLTADESFLDDAHEHGLCMREAYLEISAKQLIKQSFNKEDKLTRSTFFDPRFCQEITLDEDWTGFKTVGYSFLGEEVCCYSFKAIWLQLSESLYAEYGSSIFTEYNRVYRKNMEPFFIQTQHPSSELRKINNTTFYAPTTYNSNGQKRIILNLLKLTKYTTDDLKIYVKK